MSLINGKRIAKKLETEVKERVNALQSKNQGVKLAVVLVGDDKPSHSYVRAKERAAKRVGIEFACYQYPASITQRELIDAMFGIQADPELSGLIVQLPLPEHLNTEDTLNAIHPNMDVDCLTYENFGRLLTGKPQLVPPTPGAIMSIIEKLKIDVAGKNIVVFGTGMLVGRPLAVMLMNHGASVQTINSDSSGVDRKCVDADIIISGVGQKHLIDHTLVPEDAVVIDAGISYDKDGIMYGDVHVESVQEKAAHVTPTPGGVGPITVARLLLNTVICAEQKHHQ